MIAFFDASGGASAAMDPDGSDRRTLVDVPGGRRARSRPGPPTEQQHRFRASRTRHAVGSVEHLGRERRRHRGDSQLSARRSRTTTPRGRPTDSGSRSCGRSRRGPSARSLRLSRRRWHGPDPAHATRRLASHGSELVAGRIEDRVSPDDGIIDPGLHDPARRGLRDSYRRVGGIA